MPEYTIARGAESYTVSSDHELTTEEIQRAAASAFGAPSVGGDWPGAPGQIGGDGFAPFDPFASGSHVEADASAASMGHGLVSPAVAKIGSGKSVDEMLAGKQKPVKSQALPRGLVPPNLPYKPKPGSPIGDLTADPAVGSEAAATAARNRANEFPDSEFQWAVDHVDRVRAAYNEGGRGAALEAYRKFVDGESQDYITDQGLAAARRGAEAVGGAAASLYSSATGSTGSAQTQATGRAIGGVVNDFATPWGILGQARSGMETLAHAGERGGGDLGSVLSDLGGAAVAPFAKVFDPNAPLQERIEGAIMMGLLAHGIHATARDFMAGRPGSVGLESHAEEAPLSLADKLDNLAKYGATPGERNAARLAAARIRGVPESDVHVEEIDLPDEPGGSPSTKKTETAPPEPKVSPKTARIRARSEDISTKPVDETAPATTGRQVTRRMDGELRTFTFADAGEEAAYDEIVGPSRKREAALKREIQTVEDPAHRNDLLLQLAMEQHERESSLDEFFRAKADAEGAARHGEIDAAAWDAMGRDSGPGDWQSASATPGRLEDSSKRVDVTTADEGVPGEVVQHENAPVAKPTNDITPKPGARPLKRERIAARRLTTTRGGPIRTVSDLLDVSPDDKRLDPESIDFHPALAEAVQQYLGRGNPKTRAALRAARNEVADARERGELAEAGDEDTAVYFKQFLGGRGKGGGGLVRWHKKRLKVGSGWAPDMRPSTFVASVPGDTFPDHVREQLDAFAAHGFMEPEYRVLSIEQTRAQRVRREDVAAGVSATLDSAPSGAKTLSEVALADAGSGHQVYPVELIHQFMEQHGIGQKLTEKQIVARALGLSTKDLSERVVVSDRALSKTAERLAAAREAGATRRVSQLGALEQAASTGEISAEEYSAKRASLEKAGLEIRGYKSTDSIKRLNVALREGKLSAKEHALLVRAKEVRGSKGMVKEPSRVLVYNADDLSYTVRENTRPEQLKLGLEAVNDASAYARRSGSLLGEAITTDLVRTGGASLRGQTILSPVDLASLAQVFRDPRFETLRYFLVDDAGKVVAESGYSCRLPGAAKVFDGTPDQLVESLKAEMAAKGATGWYMLHNHPSGVSTPSGADIHTTTELCAEVPGLLGHVVIDSNEWSLITPTGFVSTHELGGADDPLLTASVPNDWLGHSISGYRDLVAVGKAMASQHGSRAILVGADAQTNGVRTIMDLPAGWMKMSEARQAAALSSFARAHGARTVYLVTDQASIDALRPRLKRAITRDLLRDAVSFDGDSLDQRDGAMPNQKFMLGRVWDDVKARKVMEERGAYQPGARGELEKRLLEVENFAARLMADKAPGPKAFRLALRAKFGDWVRPHYELLWDFAKKEADLLEPSIDAEGSHLAPGEDSEYNPRPLTSKRGIKFALATTNEAAGWARKRLEAIEGKDLELTKEDIEAGLNRLARSGGKIELIVVHGFHDESGKKLTMGIQEIRDGMEAEKFNVAAWDRYRHAMRENLDLAHRESGAISAGRQAENQRFIDKYVASVDPEQLEKWNREFDRFELHSLLLYEEYRLRPQGWAAGTRMENPNYFPSHKARTALDRMMSRVNPMRNASPDARVLRAAGGKVYRDGMLAAAMDTERIIRAGELVKSVLPFLDMAASHAALRHVVEDITEPGQGAAHFDEDVEHAIDDVDTILASMDKTLQEGADPIIEIPTEQGLRKFKLDPLVWDAIRGMHPEVLADWAKFAQLMGNSVRSLTTKYNPTFSVLVNPMLDYESAWQKEGLTPREWVRGLYHAGKGLKSAEYVHAVQSNVFFETRGVRDFLSNEFITNPKRKTKLERIANKLLAKRGVQIVLPHVRGAVWGALGYHWFGPLGVAPYFTLGEVGLSRAAQILEEATRMAVFMKVEKSLLRKGDKSEASRIASDRAAQVMNFGEAGSIGRAVSRVGVPFANVKSQVFMGNARAWKRGAMKWLLRGLLTFSFFKLMERWRFRDDPDYDALPPYVKYCSLILFKDANGAFVNIRVPGEEGVFFLGLPNLFYDYATGEHAPDDATKEWLADFEGEAMPNIGLPLWSAYQTAATYQNSGDVVDPRFNSVKGGKNELDKLLVLEADELFGSMGRLTAQEIDYYLGGSDRPPNPLQRLAAEPYYPSSPKSRRIKARGFGGGFGKGFGRGFGGSKFGP